MMCSTIRLASTAAIGLVVLLAPMEAAAAPTDKARLSGLGDVAFGAIANLSVDQRVSQDLCAYSSSPAGGYSIIASGSGSGGAFTLSSGVGTLPYEIEWADRTGLATGTALNANVPLSGQISLATNQNCSPSPGSTASLGVILRASALGSATSGSYSGTLTLILAPN